MSAEIAEGISNLPAMNEWAYFPPESGYLQYVNEFAMQENWGENYIHLDTYLENNFEICYTQGLVIVSPDGLFSMWRAGNLVERHNGDPITIACIKNRRAGKQPYYFVRVFKGKQFELKVENHTYKLQAPSAPAYEYPEFHPEYRLHFNFDHYTKDHPDRVESALQNLSDYQRYLCLYGALSRAHNLGTELAVPEWFRDRRAMQGTYQWLLPLHLSTDNFAGKPELVATLDPEPATSTYHIRTLLPPEWAYANARSVTKQVSSRFAHWQ